MLSYIGDISVSIYTHRIYSSALVTYGNTRHPFLVAALSSPFLVDGSHGRDASATHELDTSSIPQLSHEEHSAVGNWERSVRASLSDEASASGNSDRKYGGGRAGRGGMVILGAGISVSVNGIKGIVEKQRVKRKRW
ncbi:hypothetical protein Nepgr_025864 [Nepenthes gracilis]|uniref:Uncharacterized protein n=1 Tax=Nepenthes gracilis TaxID=150966 RepID=A0AAD3T8N4_NEPGR|nr:hypothetical protein Nepgr_025864 [Nepenthes gracilis]